MRAWLSVLPFLLALSIALSVVLNVAQLPLSPALWVALALAAACFSLGTLLFLQQTASLKRDIAHLGKEIALVSQGELERTSVYGEKHMLRSLSLAFSSATRKTAEYTEQATHRIERAEGRVTAALASMTDAVLVLDPGGTIEIANREAKSALGLRETFKLADAALAPRLRDKLLATHRQALHSKSAQLSDALESAIVHTANNGEPRHFLVHGAPIASPDGSALGTVLILQDATKLVRIEELRVGMFATIAHELKTPLTSLSMAVGLCLDELAGPITEKQRTLLESSKEDCARLERRVREFLEIAKVSSGALQLRRQLIPMVPSRLSRMRTQ
jgi:two-component system, NtrC family, sensor histidine kinase KinB